MSLSKKSARPTSIMTEGPIRRACNRCHTQKLSCKRLGNEPCERCVRLKAECKSSPSLRFRKSSNNATNSSNKGSHQAGGPSPREQQAQRCTEEHVGHIQDFSSAAMAYPGPYSFNGMAEHLWPNHSIDTGFLVYHSDGNQILQTFMPPTSSSTFANEVTPFAVDQGLLNPLLDGGGANDSLFASDHMGTTLPTRNGAMEDLWTTAHGTSEVPHFATVDRDTVVKDIQSEITNGGMAEMGRILRASAPRSPQDQTCNGMILDGRHHEYRTVVETIPKALLSQLCDMNVQLWELSSAVTAVILERDTRPTDLPTHCGDGVRASVPSSPPTGSSHSPLNKGRCFHMDHLFSLSRTYVKTLQAVSCGSSDDGDLMTHSNSSIAVAEDYRALRDQLNMMQNLVAGSTETGTNHSSAGLGDTSNILDKTVDRQTFLTVADSTYAALLDVYERVVHLLVHTATASASAFLPTHPLSTISNNSSNNTRGAMAASYATKNRCPDSLLKQQQHGTIASSTIATDADATSTNSAWKHTALLSCLSVCRFPDVSVGGFPVASTPTLQLGLGLRLADDFLASISYTRTALHTCLSDVNGSGDNERGVGGRSNFAGGLATLSAVSAQANDSSDAFLPLATAHDMHSLSENAPIASDSGTIGHGFVLPLAWGAGGDALSIGLPMAFAASSASELAARERRLRQELAELRIMLA